MASAQQPPVEDTLETGGEPPQDNLRPVKQFFRQRAERFEFSILATEEESDLDEEDDRPRIVRRRQSVKPSRHKNFLKQAMAGSKPRWVSEDPYFDLPEDHKRVLEAEGIKQVRVPSLVECQRFLQNPETEAYKRRAIHPVHMVINLIFNIVAAFIIWIINMFTLETIFVVLNAAGAAAYFSRRRDDWALKLDFAFLAFAVVFPLTFLIQSTFTRREHALSFLADFKSSLLSTALMTLSVDWPDSEGDSTNGRLQLPEHFNARVVRDCRDFVKLVYEYLSMPQVAHARNHVFWNKQRDTKRIHALQNGIVQDINDYMYDFSMHTEDMKKHGFPVGEASRLHQYHQYMEQRFEHLRQFKYCRTPMSTRSFGRAYILVLPWFTGPYWAWMAEGTNWWFAMLSSAFIFLMLLGLLNVQQALEDPFLADYQSLMPGIDTIKLDYEMAVVIQAIEQYYANAELQRAWELSQRNRGGEESGNEQEITKQQLEQIREGQSQETEKISEEAQKIREEVQ